jgi:hypothetical protein
MACQCGLKLGLGQMLHLVFRLPWTQSEDPSHFFLDLSMVDRRLHDDLRKIYLHLKAPRFDLHRPTLQTRFGGRCQVAPRGSRRSVALSTSLREEAAPPEHQDTHKESNTPHKEDAVPSAHPLRRALDSADAVAARRRSRPTPGLMPRARWAAA